MIRVRHFDPRRLRLAPLFGAALVVAAGGLWSPILAQQEAVEPDSVPEVLPDDHPLRPQLPPRTDRSAFEKVMGAIGWLGTRPFEFAGTAMEGTFIHIERETQLSAGLTETLGGPKEPSYVSPIFGSIGTRSGAIGGGIHLHNDIRRTRGPQFGITAAASNRSYQLYTAYVGWNNPMHHPHVRLTAFFDLDAMDQFWGLGPNSDEDDESSFSWERWGVEAIAGMPVVGQAARGLRANVHGGWERSVVWEGDDSDQPDAVALFPQIRQDQVEIGSAGAALGYDLRNKPGFPTSGLFAVGSATWYTGLDDGDLEWLRWTAELQGHVPLGSDWHVISLRATAAEVDPRGEDRVPFVYLPELGGTDILRGFDSWRWRDRATVAGSAELRWRIWQEHTPDPENAGAAEAILFYDAGDLDRSMDEIDFEDLKTSWGIGLRLYFLNRPVGNTGVGFGDEGPRFYFSLDDPF
ncbi:MAG: BamA/TamA family outer membrane protein [Gemmatimonadota bacterium]|nr:BamA/TamA family outer membrane protein [Gemmatimonadota bacterium]